MITCQEVRQKYLDFFQSKNHTIIDGGSLIPENDPSVLFTTAGMHPLVPYLLGEKHVAGKRLVNYQKCIRTTDIIEVGDNTHLTFFEMLGNWSLGDYFKQEAIEYSWEFLTSEKWLGLAKNKIAISVFAGDNNAPRDSDSAKIWHSLGVAKDRIAYLPKKDNWWGPAGKTGPCGPDTEIFYWSGQDPAPKKFNSDDDNWVEIWNNVFMEYTKTLDGKYKPLKQPNVDTGMGLERTVTLINGQNNIYQADTIKPIYDQVLKLAENKDNIKAMRIITDHVRAAVMIMGDDQGVVPSNLDQGYVVRRLLRTAIRRGREIGINQSFIKELAEITIAILKNSYTELERNKAKIISEVTIEEEKFSKVLTDGEKKINDFIKDGKISGEEAFILYTTYGFPIEEIERLGVEVDLNAFNKKISEHQTVSRQGSEQKFAGGLADHSDETTKLHTATHLLHNALRQVLGDHVAQKGSNITQKRLRFDFSHPEKMTPEQIAEVEKIVNEKITKALKVSFTEMTVDEAKARGALGLFNQKYGDRVKVYTIGDPNHPESIEICGGPHVSNTKEIGHFKIIKEQTSSAGIRRIKAIVEN